MSYNTLGDTVLLNTSNNSTLYALDLGGAQEVTYTEFSMVMFPHVDYEELRKSLLEYDAPPRSRTHI